MTPKEGQPLSSDLYAVAIALLKRQAEAAALAAEPALTPEERRTKIIADDAAKKVQAMQGNLM